MGNITSIAPTTGQSGTLVTIDGEGLYNGASAITSVTLCGVNAQILNESDTSVVVVVSAGPLRELVGDVVLTANSGAEITLTDGFKYLDAPAIFQVSPESGRGGASVTIFGSLCGGGSDISEVYLAGQKARIDSSS